MRGRVVWYCGRARGFWGSIAVVLTHLWHCGVMVLTFGVYFRRPVRFHLFYELYNPQRNSSRFSTNHSDLIVKNP